MALARISLEPPPHIDPTKATLAYGRLAIKRLNRELADDTLITRQRAVKALCDYLHDHEHIAEAINEEHELGRVTFLEYEILKSFLNLIKLTEVDIVRLNAQKAIELLTTSPAGALAVVDTGYIPLLINCARDEVDEIKIVVLDTLNHCMSLDTDKGLNSGGVKLFTQLLGHQSEDVRARAAQNILRLCVNPIGKQEALDCETIPALVTLLTDKCERVKASSSGALSFICTTNHGRYTTLNAGAIPHLLRLVEDNASRVRVNALKVIACLSETPEGRRILLDHLDIIAPHQKDINAAVSKHARIAVSVITWKP